MGDVTSFPFPTGNVPHQPLAIVDGADNALWIPFQYGMSGAGDAYIGRLTTSGTLATYKVPFAGVSPPAASGIVLAPDGNVWVAFSAGSSYLVSIAPSGVSVVHNLTPGLQVLDGHMVVGSDGALWICDALDRVIIRYTLAGVETDFPIPAGSGSPQGSIASGSDGALWFPLRSGATNSIGRMTTSGSFSSFSLPLNTGPQGIVSGPDGALWFGEQGTDKIGRITTAGVVSDFPIPTANTNPSNLCNGPDGAIYFSENLVNKVARVTTSGSITEFPLSISSQTFGCTAGSDGAVWFADYGANAVVRLH